MDEPNPAPVGRWFYAVVSNTEKPTMVPFVFVLQNHSFQGLKATTPTDFAHPRWLAMRLKVKSLADLEGPKPKAGVFCFSLCGQSRPSPYMEVGGNGDRVGQNGFQMSFLVPPLNRLNLC